MKNTYVKPEMQVEEFLANQYCANCSEKGTTTYKFVCNAQKSWGWNLGGAVYLETNGKSGLQKTGSNPDESLGGYHACSEEHEVTVPTGTSVNDIFLDGYFEPYGLIDTSVRKVKVWTAGGTNVHCSTNLSASDYIPVKS